MRNNIDYIIDEAMGVMNTSDSAFNQLVKRVVDDTLKFPQIGNKIKKEDIEVIKANQEIVFGLNDVRINTYNNTSIDWLPSLEVVWIKPVNSTPLGGYAMDKRNTIGIIIKDKYKKYDYEDTISHEIRHLHTNYIEKEYTPYKLSTSWREKNVSITQVENILYGLSKNKGMMSKLNVDLKYIDAPRTTEEAFVFILDNMYNLQPTEMKSYLESLYAQVKYAASKPYFIYITSKVPASIKFQYEIYYRLYKNFKIILDNIDTKELGTINLGILGALSKKLYAQSKNRNVEENDPTDLKIWIEYKLKQLKRWLYRAKTMIIDGIEKSKNATFDFTLLINHPCYKFELKTDPESALNFLDILIAWQKNDFINPKILYKNENNKYDEYSSICEKHHKQYPAAETFAKRMRERGIDNVDKLLENMRNIIIAFEKYVKNKREKS